MRYNLAASFQNTINKILYKKTKVAVEMFRKKTNKKSFQFIVAGGVAANETIRKNLSSLSNEMNFQTIYPDLKFCGDNAAMIAWAGIQRFKRNMIDDVNVSADTLTSSIIFLLNLCIPAQAIIAALSPQNLRSG